MHARPANRLHYTAIGAVIAAVIASLPAHAHKAGLKGDLQSFVEHVVNFKGEAYQSPIRFPKWEDALNRFYSEPYPHGYEPFINQWNAFLATIRADNPQEQARRVQEYVNFFGYVRDSTNSAGADYWKSPAEFFKASGDCEDYAIAKYWSLRKVGFDPEKLRILVVYAKKARTAHTVLRIQIAERYFLLDNLFDAVRPLATQRDYIGLYGLNETHAYLFPQRDRLDVDMAYRSSTPLSIFDIPTSAGGKAGAKRIE